MGASPTSRRSRRSGKCRTASSPASAMRRRCSSAAERRARSTPSLRWIRRECSRTRAPAIASGLRAQDPGPLFGLPIPVKDSVNTRDYPTTGGHPGASGFRPQDDAPVVAALAIGGSHRARQDQPARTLLRLDQQQSRVRRGPQSLRPRAHSRRQQRRHRGRHRRTAGAVSVSPKIPKAPSACRRRFAALQGFRPTTGRYSTRGCVPISPLFDQVGPHARSVADLHCSIQSWPTTRVRFESGSLHGVRLGVVRDYWFDDLDPEVERVTALALKRLKEAGARARRCTSCRASRTHRAHHRPRAESRCAHRAPTLSRGIRRPGSTSTTLIAQASPDIKAIFRSDVLPGGANFVAESGIRGGARPIPAGAARHRSATISRAPASPP